MCVGCGVAWEHPTPVNREFDVFDGLAWVARRLKTLALATLRGVRRGAEFSEAETRDHFRPEERRGARLTLRRWTLPVDGS